MPVYEYTCTDCREEFEKLVFGSTAVVCPACSSINIRKKMSTFGMGGGGKASEGTSSGSGSGSGCTSCSKGSCSSCH